MGIGERFGALNYLIVTDWRWYFVTSLLSVHPQVLHDLLVHPRARQGNVFAALTCEHVAILKLLYLGQVIVRDVVGRCWFSVVVHAEVG